VTSPHVNNYYVSEQQNVTIINNTTVIHNTTIVNNTVNNTTIVNNNVTNNRVTVNNYAGGPDPAAVSRVTGTPLRPVVLRESNTPGESMAGGGLAIYRPRINAASAEQRLICRQARTSSCPASHQRTPRKYVRSTITHPNPNNRPHEQ
jgi:hypothetical protein